MQSMAIRGFIVHDRESGAYALTDSGRATLAVILKNAGLAPKCSAHTLTAASPATSPLRFKNLVRDRKLKSPPPDPLLSPRFGDSSLFEAVPEIAIDPSTVANWLPASSVPQQHQGVSFGYAAEIICQNWRARRDSNS